MMQNRALIWCLDSGEAFQQGSGLVGIAAEQGDSLTTVDLQAQVDEGLPDGANAVGQQLGRLHGFNEQSATRWSLGMRLGQDLGTATYKLNRLSKARSAFLSPQIAPAGG